MSEIGIGLAEEPLQERPTSPQYDPAVPESGLGPMLMEQKGVKNRVRRWQDQSRAASAQERMLKLQALAGRFDTAKKVIDASGFLKGDQRAQFLELASKQFDEVSPGFGETFKLMAARPDASGALEDISNTPTGQAMLQADPSGETLLNFIKTEAGQKAMNTAADKKYIPSALKKLSLGVKNAEKYIDKEKLARIRKDGKTTIAELQEMNDAMPENIRLTPQEFSTVMHSRNQNTLLQFGIKTDEMIEFEEKEKGKAAGSKVTKSDRIMELSSKMARGQASKEEKKEYRLLINADPIRQLINREVDPLLEEDEEEEKPKGKIPQVKSDADYDKLPSGAEFIDPQGKKRVKP